MFLGMAVLAAVFGAGIYLIVFRAPMEVAEKTSSLAREVAVGLGKAFQLQPEIRERGTIVFVSNRDITHLVTSETNFRARHTFEHSWLGSTKRFEVDAAVRARFGYDLEKQVQFEVDSRGMLVRVAVPPPELLSLELSDFQVRRDEDGIWNRLTAQDRENAMNELRSTAVKSLDLPQLGGRARANMEQRTRAILEPMGLRVQFSDIAEPRPKP